MAIVTISHEMGSGGAEFGWPSPPTCRYGHVDHDVILERGPAVRARRRPARPPEEDKPVPL